MNRGARRQRGLSLQRRRDVDPLDSRAARAAALDALARRDHSSEELRRKLLGKGYDPAVVAALMRAAACREIRSTTVAIVENFVAYHAGGPGPVAFARNCASSACRARRSMRALGGLSGLACAA